jgi:hypothetical protein
MITRISSVIRPKGLSWLRGFALRMTEPPGKGAVGVSLHVTRAEFDPVRAVCWRTSRPEVPRDAQPQPAQAGQRLGEQQGVISLARHPAGVASGARDVLAAGTAIGYAAG